MWVGLVNKNTYSVEAEIEKEFGSLLYYGGRERSIKERLRYSEWDNGNGAIHGFGGICKQCEYYTTGDWITYQITMKDDDECISTPNCKIFKNGKLMLDINALPVKSVVPKKKIKHEKILSGLNNIFGTKMKVGVIETKKLDQKKEDEDMYFCVVVDDAMDGFIVEEVLYNPSQNVSI